MAGTIIDSLFEYFRDCPLMTESRLNIDYLPENTSEAGIEYAISVMPTDEIITLYKDGGARCRYTFVISSVNNYGADEWQSIENIGFFDKLAAWMRLQTRRRNLPLLPAGYTARSIAAIGHGYLYQPDVNAGKYQIQCQMEYYRGGIQVL